MKGDCYSKIQQIAGECAGTCVWVREGLLRGSLGSWLASALETTREKREEGEYRMPVQGHGEDKKCCMMAHGPAFKV